MKSSDDWVIVGRLGRPHGLKGYISVYSFTDPLDNILSYPDWHVSIQGHWTLLKRLSAETHNRFIAVLLDGYVERETVATLTNLDIAVKAAQLPALPSGEYYWRQLMGMTVMNTQGRLLGTVMDIIPTGANDVLVVVGDERYLIPYRYGAVVLDISEEKQQMIVDWDAEYL